MIDPPDSDPPSDHSGSWAAHRMIVMDGLKRQDRSDSMILDRLSRIETSIATLNVKAGAWGAIAGIVVLVAALLAKSLLK